MEDAHRLKAELKEREMNKVGGLKCNRVMVSSGPTEDLGYLSCGRGRSTLNVVGPHEGRHPRGDSVLGSVVCGLAF